MSDDTKRDLLYLLGAVVGGLIVAVSLPDIGASGAVGIVSGAAIGLLVARLLTTPSDDGPEETIPPASRERGSTSEEVAIFSCLDREGHAVQVVRIKLPQFPNPEDWPRAVEASLRAVVEAGAEMAWCPTESAFGGLPVWREQHQIWAAYTLRYGFRLSARPGETFQYLDDRAMCELREYLEPRHR